MGSALWLILVKNLLVIGFPVANVNDCFLLARLFNASIVDTVDLDILIFFLILKFVKTLQASIVRPIAAGTQS